MNAPEGPKAAATRSHAHGSGSGFAFGFAAYALWGVLPVYFKALADVDPVDIVAHRVLWSVPFLAILITLTRTWAKVRFACARPQTLGMLALTAILIGTNWLLYVYAVTSGHILAASFGYYLNPLANVLLGRFVLREKLNRLQWTAVAIAAAGISILAAGALSQLWLSLALCVTFALYGLFRKIVLADALTGLAIETSILFPFAIATLGWGALASLPVLGTTVRDTELLALSGIVSTTPLLLFTAATKRLQYSTLGMLQFVAPTLQFLIAVLLYGERVTIAHAIAFPAIWLALVLYVIAMLSAPRLPQAPE
ncbi:MAG TPA: EamA family transporter RarD [Sphingomicrobium sp.]|jgi:chloramphenicol-sensitive protein RarD|nr:EamA family transporter RarD [Sphingomicrobium sp.]